MAREMNKKLLTLFCAVQFAAVMPAMAAVSIKKAAPVATQEASVGAGAASLLPTVLGLVSNVQQLNAKQKALTTECMPSSQEIQFVDNMMKEWAKTGAMTADEAAIRLGRRPCSGAVGGYESQVRRHAGTGSIEDVCFDWFGGTGNDGMVWERYPKVGKAEYCKDGTSISMCPRDERETVSDIYDIFNLIDFGVSDYTKTEATMAARLITKIDDCSYSKISAKKREMWGNFLVDTMGSVGQKTNTSTIMDAVQNVTGGGGLSSLGGLATQLMGQ